ncbi:HlyD family secretion protein [Mesorhizobium sp. B1-1-8]|nr:HlyD family secretion protein [Mesorhizobium sp. B1-1-8]UCI05654.1 HlyD family secretion protein [Mesorhizobium sp. B1-1-8]
MDTAATDTPSIAATDIRAASEMDAPPATTNSSRRVALVVVLLTIALFALSIAMERLTPYSAQATVQAYVVRMAPEVAGRVIEVGVSDNARVTQGQTLFRIDPQPYELAVAEASARLERIGQSIGASTAAVDSAQARVVKAEADRDNVRAQFQRTKTLVDRGISPRAKLDDAKRAVDVAEATVTGAEADLSKAQEELGPQGADNPQLKEALATAERARLNLAHTTVVAPSNGVISNLQLSVGQIVGVGQSALTFIDSGTIWVTAAVKENSLEYLEPGDEAEVVLDSLPGMVFATRVESVGWGVGQGGVDLATGLPNIRNQSGWVRDSQRFPVRLVFTDGPPRGVRFGSQVNVMIYASDNSAMNAVAYLWIRIVSVLTYLS